MAAVCGAKLLAPTIEKAAAAGVDGGTRSVGVSPLLARTPVPRSGCMINPASDARSPDRVKTSSRGIAGPWKANTIGS